MSGQKILGIVLLVVGGILLFMGLQATDTLGERMNRFFTGNYTETTVWYLILGAAAAIGGLLLALSGRRVAA